MQTEMAIGGRWNQPQSRKKDTLTMDGSEFANWIAPGVTSTDDVGHSDTTEPLQAAVVRTAGNLQAGDLIGRSCGGPNKVLVGRHVANQANLDFPNLVAPRDTIKANLVIDGDAGGRLKIFYSAIRSAVVFTTIRPISFLERRRQPRNTRAFGRSIRR